LNNKFTKAAGSSAYKSKVSVFKNSHDSKFWEERVEEEVVKDKEEDELF
jgi:hypothetical protein